MLKYIFHKSRNIDLALLIARITGGGFMLTHGSGKLLKVLEGNFEFGDPLGIGAEVSLLLVVFSEILCAFFLLLGLFTRWVTLPLIITMIVAVFVVHLNHGFGKQEMGLMYLGYYFVLLLLGPGKYSIDSMIAKKRF